MARNSERALMLLNRWQRVKDDVAREQRGGAGKDRYGRRRPRNVEAIAELAEAEHWRHQLMRELSLKLSEVQVASLGEARLWRANDDINRLLKEKPHWDNRIAVLKGERLAAPNQGGAEDRGSGGDVLTGPDGYKYFGALKNFRAVQTLFDRAHMGSSSSGVVAAAGAVAARPAPGGAEGGAEMEGGAVEDDGLTGEKALGWAGLRSRAAAQAAAYGSHGSAQRPDSSMGDVVTGPLEGSSLNLMVTKARAERAAWRAQEHLAADPFYLGLTEENGPETANLLAAERDAERCLREEDGMG